jgi:hypothetical protein
VAQQPLVGHGLLNIEASRSHSGTPHPVRRLLDEWSARCRDVCLTTHNTHKRQASIPSAGLEPAIPATEWPQTHALDHAATGIGDLNRPRNIFSAYFLLCATKIKYLNTSKSIATVSDVTLLVRVWLHSSVHALQLFTSDIHTPKTPTCLPTLK